LSCRKVDTGEVICQKDYLKEYGAELPVWGMTGAPLVDGPRLICLVGGTPNAKVVAFDKLTGRELWRSLSFYAEPGYAQLIIVNGGGTRQLIAWHPQAVSVKGERKDREGRQSRDRSGSHNGYSVDRPLMLLTWSRIDSGQARPAIEPIDVREATDDVAAQLGVLAEEKQQTIEVASVGRPRALADPILLRQALTNVVDNAIKHGADGGRVDIRMFATGPSVIIDVSDNGPAIPPQREALIFERFYRGTASNSADGVGLGLSIAKRALDAFGGRLHLEKATRGCTFRITLPSAPAAGQTERLKAAG
jgi:signal transduction histidine kinase